MPLTPIVQLIAHEVRNFSFSKHAKRNDELKETFAKLLYGVPLRYSCPLPLLVDTAALSSFQRQIFADLRDFYIGTCRAIAAEYPDFPRLSQAAQFEAIFILNPRVPKLMVYPGYASGDMYGIGATMLFDESLHLWIVKDDNKGRIDRSQMVKGFLTAFLPDDSRISIVPTAKGVDSRAYLPPFDSLKKAEQSYLTWLSDALWTFIRDKRQIYFAVDLFFGTNYVALRFGDSSQRRALRSVVRNAWDVTSSRWSGGVVKNVGTFLKARGFVEDQKFPRDRHVVVLWTRFTGKTGGAHVEYDTSFEGLRQLLQVAHDKGNDWVIIVGDKPKLSGAFDVAKLKRRTDKITEIIRASPIRAVDLTEFWTDDRWKADFKRRTDQFKLFEVLHYHNHVKHLGARSGNLESLALLGYQVRYFEDAYAEGEDALDKKRMESWHATVGYQRIQIEKVPTRSGKYILEKEDHYPKWTYPTRWDPRVNNDFTPCRKQLLPGKRYTDRLKPVEIGRVNIVTELGRETWPPPRDLARPVKIFDIARIQPDFEPPLEVLPFFRPLHEKGFSLQDLYKLGQYLAPDPWFKVTHPL